MGPPGKRAALLLVAGCLYAISLALPAITYEGETVWLGARAAAVAVFFPVIWLQFPLVGFFLGTFYLLLVATLVGILKKRAFATGAAIALVSTMALWGFSLPTEPSNFAVGPPHGHLGSGFWLWLASGTCLLLASFEPRDRERRRVWITRGLIYSAVAAASAVFIAGLKSRPPSEEKLRAVEAEKREFFRQGSSPPSQ